MWNDLTHDLYFTWNQKAAFYHEVRESTNQRPVRSMLPVGREALRKYGGGVRNRDSIQGKASLEGPPGRRRPPWETTTETGLGPHMTLSERFLETEALCSEINSPPTFRVRPALSFEIYIITCLSVNTHRHVHKTQPKSLVRYECGQFSHVWIFAFLSFLLNMSVER